MLNSANISGRITNDSNISGSISSIKNVSGNIDKPGKVYEKDYEKLDNLPSINGTKLIGNYDEIDPTVPEWAKEETKPTYTYDEVEAVGAENELSFEEIDRMVNAVFGV